MSHYVSSPANLSPPHCSPFYKPHVLQAGEQRRCVFHCHWLVRERVFLCFQLHAKRPSGKSICQRARQDLMGAASAGGGWHFTQWPWMSRSQTICQRLAFQLSVDVSRIHEVSCTLCQDAGVCIIKIKWVNIGKCGEERSSLGSLFFSNLEVVLLLLGSQTLFWYSEVLISYFWKEQDTLIHIQTDFKCNRVSWMATFYGPSLCPMLTVALAKGEGPIPNATFDNHPKSFNGPSWPTPSFLYVC